MSERITDFQIKKSFFTRGKWLILFWLCFIFIFSLSLSYPTLKVTTYSAGYLIFLHLIILFTAYKLFEVFKTINVIIIAQIVVSLSMGGLMLYNPITSLVFLIGFLPIIIIEEITFIDSKKWINMFSACYIIILLFLGTIGDWENEFFIFEAVIVIVFISKYYYSLIYNNFKKKIELEKINAELNDAYQEVTTLTTRAVKQKLARDLHDTLVQDLIGINLQLALIENHVQKNDLSGTAKSLKDTQKLTKEAIISSRKTITEYRKIKDEDIKLTLKGKVIEKVQLLQKRYGLATNVNIAADLELPSKLLIDVVRMINEALINVVRHAETEEAQVDAYLKGEKLVIKISNNGIPFPEKYQQRHDHYGLIGMRERAQSHNGDLKIWSTAEVGTIVLIEIPLGGKSNV
ncbi:sensor histidine kinase [Liquorilactobacillus hordei]|uniref:histidine kinase n=1 Tax=Liquorilactobacillus hordei TaxID=468911 RepID=A0A3Q8CCX3_9LACO|nr:histidine kinase [Liquorilactobacillus hordei]AUJ30405.1 histidine kinase [Liquorilactobacillus hordei]